MTYVNEKTDITDPTGDQTRRNVMLKHDWLEPCEQAIMDSATSTSDLYTGIALLRMPTSEKCNLGARLGGMPANEDVVRAQLLTAGSLSPLDWDDYFIVRLKMNGLVSENLIVNGADRECVHPDPTGEFWGNILLDADKMQRNVQTHLCEPLSNNRTLFAFWRNGNYGVTAEMCRTTL